MRRLVLKWLLLGVPVIAMTVIGWLAAPVVALFASRADGSLPRWLRWFQPYDHTCWGGEDWQRDNPDYRTWWGITRQLQRNIAGTFSFKVAGLWPKGDVVRQGDPLTSNREPGHSGCCYTRVANAFLFHYVSQWGGSGRCLRIVCGWKLYYEQDGGTLRQPTDRKAKPAQWVFVAWPLAGFDALSDSNHPSGATERQ